MSDQTENLSFREIRDPEAGAKGVLNFLLENLVILLDREFVTEILEVIFLQKLTSLRKK
jgi:hypothetical protein